MSEQWEFHHVIHFAETAAEALELARQEVPASGTVIEERLAREAHVLTSTYVVPAGEQDPEGWIRSIIQFGSGVIREMRLVTAARRGILGIGKRQAVFEAEVSYPAQASIVWKKKARIVAEIGNKHHRYELNVGSGVCDVCNRALVPGKAYKVPVRVFYKSPAYRKHCEYLASGMGVSVDEFIAGLRSMDKSTHSAVCDGCIHMF